MVSLKNRSITRPTKVFQPVGLKIYDAHFVQPVSNNNSSYYYYYKSVFLKWHCRSCCRNTVQKYKNSIKCDKNALKNQIRITVIGLLDCSGNETQNKWVFSGQRKRRSDCSDQMWVTSNAFQALAAATGKARSPSVERLVGGTSSVMVSRDRVCHLMLRLEVRWTDSDRLWHMRQ